MRKILIVANVDKEHILKFHIPTLKMLKSNDWIVHVACAGCEDIPYCDKKWKMPYKRNPFSFKTIKGIYELRKIINSENYNIIHCHTPTGGVVARIAAMHVRKKGCTVIYTAHGFHFYHGAPLVNWIGYFPIERLLSKMNDVLITINNEDYKNANKYHFKSKRIIQLPGIGVDLSKFINKNDSQLRKSYREMLDIPKDAYVLIYVAEIIKNKNQEMLLKTLQDIQVELPNTYLLLVGPDHSNNKFSKLIEKGKYKNVILTGWRNDISNLLNCSDLYVASSIREGLPLNLIEAIQEGLIVIATKNRGHQSIINNEKNGFLVNINDYKSMSKQIINILRNQEMYEYIKENAQETVKKYDSQNVLETLNNLYEELFNKLEKGE